MSGRDELLDEAIVKAKEAGDWQLAEWLRMARGSESAARWYTEKLRDTNRTIRKLLDENAKLREENKRLRGVAIDYYTEMLNSDDVLGQIMARKKLRELGIKED